ncbi:hypothetical protein Geob_3089 [Geotalea daltonii FRC-32]|uniref:DUF4140 domain-containing protein n=1 Tax=Geotalea daltonii (strain DSM 22248 / JCM 15807 / FRC-32) TaxID=316067 RepID=B9M3L1_GEODF|nr:DUF4140 domain-containing protein [Geotalea daltonii]ACM21432.1 hypothetical protein Geob_3089 [Geotalea daltonii FRC-32]
MGILLPVVAALLLAVPAFAADKEVTLYLDGARIQRVASAVNGYAEVVLPASVLPDSLRIKPAAGVAIDRVETISVTSDPKQGQQLEKLTERRDQLEDRLKALSAREQIFTAAAKSQSGKAPRKTKSNPEPLTAIRQGTDFAIAQLEWVYQAKRKADKELKAVQLRLESTKKAVNIGGSVVRIWVKGKGGKVSVSYLVGDTRWLPVYDFRINGAGVMQVFQRASIPAMGKGVTVAVVSGLMADAVKLQPITLNVLPLPEVMSQTLPVENLVLSAFPQPALSFSVTNDSARPLPAGEASCYYSGEYLSRFRFAGLAKGETGAIKCGK